MSLTTTADEVFHKWSDKGEDNGQIIDGLLSWRHLAGLLMTGTDLEEPGES